MRRILLLAAISVCAALSGCDQDQQTAQNAAPPAPVCACRPTAPQETAAATQTAASVSVMHHRRHHWRSERIAWNGYRHGRYTRTDFTESVLAPYNYVSGSSVSYVERNSSYGGYVVRGRHVRETIAANMTGARLDPWHGYDVDCPQP